MSFHLWVSFLVAWLLTQFVVRFVHNNNVAKVMIDGNFNNFLHCVVAASMELGIGQHFHHIVNEIFRQLFPSIYLHQVLQLTFEE